MAIKTLSDKEIFRDYHDRSLMLSMAGFTGGLAIGNIMTQHADIKHDTILENVHHWVIGLIASIVGLILSFSRKFKNSGLFVIAIGLGIVLTDFKDMSKQIDNVLDKEPLTKGLEIEGLILNSNMIPTH